MPIFRNQDGLRVRYGLTQAEKSKGGHINKGSWGRQLVVHFDHTDLPVVDTTARIDEGEYGLPAGAYLDKVTLVVTTAFVGATGTLSIGLQQEDGTEIDNDGIDVAIPVASLTAGARIDADGALIGTNIGSFNGFLVFLNGTADFTAGEATLIIDYWDDAVEAS